jgi:subfamily B ATP-binding cassette protein MsbA
VISDTLNFILKSTIKNKFIKENRLIIREFKNFRKIVLFAILFALLSALFEGISVAFIASFLQGITNPGEPPIQSGVVWIDKILLATNALPTQRIYRLSGLLLITIFMRSGFDYLSALYGKDASLKLVDNLRKRVFDQLESFKLSFYSKSDSGALVNTIIGELDQVQRAFNLLSQLLVTASKILAYLVSMLILSWQLFLVSAVMFSLISAGFTSLTRQVREKSFDVPKATNEFASTALSFINGIRTVHASGTMKFERYRYYTATQNVYQSRLAVFKLTTLVKPLIECLGSILLIGLVTVSYGLLIATGKLKAAELLTFLFVLLRTTPLVSAVNGTWVEFISIQGAMGAVSDLLKREDKPYFQDGKIEFHKLKQAIELRAVDFGYEPDEPVLHDITLSINQGETTALVGASGAGKTTLADLLPRFFDPTQGQILIDGTDIRYFKIDTLRQKMAIVSQDTFIFNDTIRANITYGVSTLGHDEISDNEVYEAASQANALDFILDMPEGFETSLGDRGIRLSGGQRQRIAIARALLRNPEILILDEATSALDSITEKLIQESLEKLSKGRTVIAIAHRLSTISRADKVVVLEKGRIVEQGSYQELIEQRGKLWNYHRIQHI